MVKMAFTVFLLMARALPSRVTAQAPVTLEGRVLDESTGIGIPSATVELRGQGVRVTADDGTFRFAALRPGTYALSAAAFGYVSERRVIEVGHTLTISIELDRSPLQLDGVVAELIDVEGRIRDPEADFLLVDAEVVTDFGRASGTDRHGRFRLRGVLRDDSLRLAVRAFGYLPLDTTIVPGGDRQHVFDLRADSVMRAMVDIQVERLKVRASPRFAALFRNLDRERILRRYGTGTHTVLTMLMFEYGQKLDRLVCVVIDERSYDNVSHPGGEVGTTLNLMVPEEIERLEFMFGGEMLRIYTRAFVRDMTAREMALRTPQVFPFCM